MRQVKQSDNAAMNSDGTPITMAMMTSGDMVESGALSVIGAMVILVLWLSQFLPIILWALCFLRARQAINIYIKIHQPK